MTYPEAREELLKLYGVGVKVADCICLMALHELSAFQWIPIFARPWKSIIQAVSRRSGMGEWKVCSNSTFSIMN